MNKNSTSNRAVALDALRGLAIIGMILSGSIPHGGMLPGWMYHAQVPPPDHVFNPNLPGITWVDLVFPFFLFAMGAAFPFALSKKIEIGIPKWRISLDAVKRGLLIAAFAIYIQHIKPWAINPSPNTLVWIVSLIGFLLLFPMLMRFPKSFNKLTANLIKIAGWVGAAIIMYAFGLLNEKGFSVGRSDIIILVLANVAVAGSIIWIFTKDNWLPRLGVLGILIALRLTQSVEGSWNNAIWTASPADWLYKLYYMQYLFIVIPGTIVGDIILKWMKKNSGESSGIPDNKRLSALSVLLILVIIGNLYGLYARFLIGTLIFNLASVLGGYYLLNKSSSDIEKFVKSLFNWGNYWLILGLFFEAYEGGIKKDHPTLSYYFLTTGLAIYCYISLMIVLEYFKKQKWFTSVIENGQNPMIAYIVGHTFITPILALTGLSALLNYLLINPWLGFLKGVIFTALVMLVTSLCTKKKWFWRT